MDQRFGDTSVGAFIGEVINNCLREGDDRLTVDMNLLVSMCRAEPKGAQVAMQVFAADLMRDLDGASVAQAAGNAMNLRLITAALFIAYCASREHVDAVPPELAFAVSRYPVILECAAYVSADQLAPGQR